MRQRHMIVVDRNSISTQPIRRESRSRKNLDLHAGKNANRTIRARIENENGITESEKRNHSASGKVEINHTIDQESHSDMTNANGSIIV